MADNRDDPVIAEWARHPGHALMRKRFLASRDAYYVSLGNTLYRTPGKLAEADLHNKAAFFRGALWILNQPVFTATAIEHALASQQSQQEEPNDE